jgi:hypothetical protein
MRKAIWAELSQNPALDVAVGVNGETWMIGVDNGLYQWSNNTWQPRHFDHDNPTRLAVDQHGNAWVITKDQGLYQYDNQNWTPIDLPGQACDIGIGGTDERIWVAAEPEDSNDPSGGRHIYRRTGNDWEYICAAGTDLAVAPDGAAWHVNLPGKVYEGRVIPGTDPRNPNVSWTLRLDPETHSKAKDIGIGRDGSTWIVCEDGELYLWCGDRWESKNQLFWFQTDSVKPTRLSVAPDGTPIIVDADSIVRQMVFVDQLAITTHPYPGEANGLDVFRQDELIGRFLSRVGKETTDDDEYMGAADYVFPPSPPQQFPSAPQDLRELAARLGGDHFTFYQVILQDEPGFDAPATPFGQTPRAPYIDPPRGGFSPSGPAPDGCGLYSDNHPWYYDEYVPAWVVDHQQSWQSMERSDRKMMSFNDDPHFGSTAKAGDTMRFKTWAVVVDVDGGPVCFLGGFQWKCVRDESSGRTAVHLGPTPFDYPSVGDFEYFLSQTTPGAPAWFVRAQDTEMQVKQVLYDPACPNFKPAPLRGGS